MSDTVTMTVDESCTGDTVTVTIVKPYHNVVAFLGSFGGDVGRSVIADGLGVPCDARLSYLLRTAVKDGAIIKTGAKRGTKYSLPANAEV